jgi:hypothetical protein
LQALKAASELFQIQLIKISGRNFDFTEPIMTRTNVKIVLKTSGFDQKLSCVSSSTFRMLATLEFKGQGNLFAVKIFGK